MQVPRSAGTARASTPGLGAKRFERVNRYRSRAEAEGSARLRSWMRRRSERPARPRTKKASATRGPRRRVFVAGVGSGVPGDGSSSLGWGPGSPTTGLRRWGRVRGPRRWVFVAGVGSGDAPVTQGQQWHFGIKRTSAWVPRPSWCTRSSRPRAVMAERAPRAKDRICRRRRSKLHVRPEQRERNRIHSKTRSRVSMSSAC